MVSFLFGTVYFHGRLVVKIFFQCIFHHQLIPFPKFFKHTPTTMTIWYWIEFFPPTTGMLKSQLVCMYLYICTTGTTRLHLVLLCENYKSYTTFIIILFALSLSTYVSSTTPLTTLLPCAIIVIFKVTIIFPTRVENGTTVLIRFWNWTWNVNNGL